MLVQSFLSIFFCSSLVDATFSVAVDNDAAIDSFSVADVVLVSNFVLVSLSLGLVGMLLLSVSSYDVPIETAEVLLASGVAETACSTLLPVYCCLEGETRLMIVRVVSP